MVIIEEPGDLFSVDSKYSIAHCISLDCAMGKGIALEFSKRYPLMREYLKEVIKANNITGPITLSYQSSDRIIYNIITKENYWDKPTYNTLALALDGLAWYCTKSQKKFLAIPLIGCGLDRLNWKNVKGIIEEKFSSLDIEILVKRG